MLAARTSILRCSSAPTAPSGGLGSAARRAVRVLHRGPLRPTRGDGRERGDGSCGEAAGGALRRDDVEHIALFADGRTQWLIRRNVPWLPTSGRAVARVRRGRQVSPWGT